MLKGLTVILMLVTCCYCLENADMVKEESRAKRKRRPIRLLAMILLFVMSKVAIFKVASFFMFMAVFQKLFSVAGLVLGYFMRNQTPPIPSQASHQTYGPPQEYNTLGYSYGPPDHEVFNQDSALPTIKEFGKKFNNWLKP